MDGPHKEGTASSGAPGGTAGAPAVPGAPGDTGSAHPPVPQRRRRAPIILAAVCVLALAGVAASLSVCSSEGTRALRDPNATLGQLEGKSAEEIQAEVDREVGQGMFSISIAAQVEFADGSSQGEIRIENVPSNRYLMQVSLARNDTGEELYKSGIIEPNTHIRSASLDVDLDKGTYPCTATFFALDPGTEKAVGQTAAEITLSVLG